MVYKECNLRAVVYKVQTFGTTQARAVFFLQCDKIKNIERRLKIYFELRA
jgi:hypothetical protein